MVQGSPRELLAKYGGSQVLEVRPATDMKSEVLMKLRHRGFQWQEVEDMLYIFQGDGQVLDEDLMHGLVVLNQHVPTLEDVFLKLTGRAIRE